MDPETQPIHRRTRRLKSRTRRLYSRLAGGSSNGKTPDSGSGYRGSNPCPPTNDAPPEHRDRSGSNGAPPRIQASSGKNLGSHLRRASNTTRPPCVSIAVRRASSWGPRERSGALPRSRDREPKQEIPPLPIPLPGFSRGPLAGSPLDTTHRSRTGHPSLPGGDPGIRIPASPLGGNHGSGEGGFVR